MTHSHLKLEIVKDVRSVRVPVIPYFYIYTASYYDNHPVYLDVTDLEIDNYSYSYTYKPIAEYPNQYDPNKDMNTYVASIQFDKGILAADVMLEEYVKYLKDERERAKVQAVENAIFDAMDEVLPGSKMILSLAKPTAEGTNFGEALSTFNTDIIPSNSIPSDDSSFPGSVSLDIDKNIFFSVGLIFLNAQYAYEGEYARISSEISKIEKTQDVVKFGSCTHLNVRIKGQEMDSEGTSGFDFAYGGLYYNDYLTVINTEGTTEEMYQNNKAYLDEYIKRYEYDVVIDTNTLDADTYARIVKLNEYGLDVYFNECLPEEMQSQMDGARDAIIESVNIAMHKKGYTSFDCNQVDWDTLVTNTNEMEALENILKSEVERCLPLKDGTVEAFSKWLN